MSYDYYLVKKDKKEYINCGQTCIPLIFIKTNKDYDIKEFKNKKSFDDFYKKFITELYNELPNYLSLEKIKIIAEKIYNWIGKDKIVCCVDTSDLAEIVEDTYKCIDFI